MRPFIFAVRIFARLKNPDNSGHGNTGIYLRNTFMGFSRNNIANMAVYLTFLADTRSCISNDYSISNLKVTAFNEAK